MKIYMNLNFRKKKKSLLANKIMVEQYLSLTSYIIGSLLKQYLRHFSIHYAPNSILSYHKIWLIFSIEIIYYKN